MVLDTGQVTQGAQIIADMQIASGLDAGQDSCSHGMESPSYQLSQQQLKIEKLVYGGEGLSRGPEGVVLVPFTLAGETVEANVGAQEKGVLRGTLQRVDEASPDRVEPRCIYFTHCGGCHYQQGAYEAQLVAKRAILEETLLRFAKI